jgi:hypothetical protein
MTMSIPLARPARVTLLVRVGLLIGVDASVLIALAPDWPALGRHLARADSWVDQVGADQAVASIAGAALWLCAVWLAVALSAIGLAAGPGLGGRAGRRLVRFVVPATIQRAVGGLLGLSLALGLAAPLAAPGAAAASTSAGNPAPSSSPPAPGTTTVPSWPMSPPPTVSATPAAPTPPPGRYVVAAGDSLWRLAVAQLADPAPARVRTQVARWYAANRTVIGSDPSLIRPGQILLVPPVDPIGTSIGTAP